MPKRRFTEGGWRRDPWFRSLCAAIAACKSELEIADFLRDVGTLSELQAWSERLEVAKQLAQGIPYRKVAENTGASTTTVTRVARFLENGEGGYRRILHAYQHRRLALGGHVLEGKKSQEPSSALKRYLS
jgi:TrpR-related protein YerC/YecD